MSPLVWDLGHIAAFEDLWLCQRAGGLEPLEPDLASVYDASEIPRADRGDIPYLRRDDALAYMEAVRERALGVLGARRRRRRCGTCSSSTSTSTTRRCCRRCSSPRPAPTRPDRDRRPPARRPSRDGSPSAAGPFEMGVPGDGFAYDNERPRARGRPAGVRDRPRAGDQRRLRRVRGRRRLRAPLAVDARRAGSGACATGVTRPLYWTADGARAPLRPRRAARARRCR